mmetsp:Transcript_50377/g.131111  ORF Transcript_50377/g.131111 Transcript_50377/m.131111 type:complete len:245 (+) Transcript_50377:525-1259(+)
MRFAPAAAAKHTIQACCREHPQSATPSCSSSPVDHAHGRGTIDRRAGRQCAAARTIAEVPRRLQDALVLLSGCCRSVLTLVIAHHRLLRFHGHTLVGLVWRLVGHNLGLIDIYDVFCLSDDLLRLGDGFLRLSDDLFRLCGHFRHSLVNLAHLLGLRRRLGGRGDLCRSNHSHGCGAVDRCSLGEAAAAWAVTEVPLAGVVQAKVSGVGRNSRRIIVWRRLQLSSLQLRLRICLLLRLYSLLCD